MSIFRKIKTKYLITIVIALSFISVFAIPKQAQVTEGVSAILGMVGLLFAILVGFFITDLWSRFQIIRDGVAVEVSGLQTYYLFVQVQGY